MSDDTIRFQGHRRAYGAFSNFFNAPFTVSGVEWPTTEHQFQAKKFPSDPHVMESIRTAATPGDAARMGRSRAHPLRPDWEEVKEEIMQRALTAKFTQHQRLRDILVGTGDRRLVEASPTDYQWGEGRDRTGKNRLGELLMQLRYELQHGDFTASA